MKKDKSEALTVADHFDTGQGIGTISPDALREKLARGRVMPTVRTLENAGDYIEGVLVGPSSPVEIKDQFTGELKPLGTWEFQLDGGINVRLLTSYQLDRDLALLVGRRVFVCRGEQKQLKDRRVNQFIVADMS